MKSAKTLLALAIVASILLFGCTNRYAPGADRDMHGCIGSAGYVWCEESGKCVRPWETNCSSITPYIAPAPSPSPEPMPGSDRDEHGCIGSAGYSWCEPLSQCIRPWETNCETQQLDGGDRDSHGCIPSAGYSWCESKQKCLGSWEESCTVADREAKAREYCGAANVAQVSVCGNYIRTVSTLMGGGSTFYSDNGTETRCPLVAPDSQSQECNLLLYGSNCVEKVVCGKSDLRILTERFFPLSYRLHNGSVGGSSTEVVNGILAYLNQTADIEMMEWPYAYSIATSDPGVLLYSTERTPEREPLFSWVGPIGTYDKLFYAPSGSSVSIKSMNDAKAVESICVVRDDARAEYLQALNFTNLYLAQSDGECIMRTGNDTLWLGSSQIYASFLALWVGSETGPLKPVYTVSKGTDVYLAFSKGTPEATVKAWQNALSALRGSGAATYYIPSTGAQ